MPRMVLGRRESWMLIALLAATVGLRGIGADQPIVENYVGRQIPTAMVARNIERGLGPLNPQLDTGPFPNLFLVEPPIYQVFAVWLHFLLGINLEAAGRVVSALGYGLAAWGLHGLCRRREGSAVAGIAVVVFALLPVGLRYGRAFQPDALMLGFVVAGLRLWDDFEVEGRWYSLVGAWIALALGFAIKITSAYLLIPLGFALIRERRAWKFALAGSTLLPGLLWYGLVWNRVESGLGSRAMLDNTAIWMRVFSGAALLRFETYRWLGRFLVVRAFTPIVFLFFLIGMIRARPDRLWRAWTLAGVGALLALAAKIHHEYYMLTLAVPVAAGAARAWIWLWECGRFGRLAGPLVAIVFVVLAAVQSVGTWRTPAEWRGIVPVGRELNAAIPADAGLVAREALLYYSGRRGYRLEVDRAAGRRAAGEWGAVLDGEGETDPLALLEFYRGRGAEYVADLVSPADADERRTLHAAIRREYRVLIDRQDFLLARMVPRNQEVVDAAR